MRLNYLLHTTTFPRLLPILWLTIFGMGLNTTECTASTMQVLFESASLGEVGLPVGTPPAIRISEGVFNGVRFELSQPSRIHSIGGHFNGRGTFFGALVELDNIDDMPDTIDLTSDDVIGTNTLDFPPLSSEVFAPLNITVESGFYALVFGGGLFDTSGNGAMPSNGEDIGSPDYIGAQPGNSDVWFRWDGAFDGYRMTVLGETIPEPNTLILALIATASTHRRRYLQSSSARQPTAS